VTPAPVSTPQAARAAYGPSRLIIPTLGVNSTWLPLGWLPNGVTMDSPPGPGDLGWYTFTAQPGSAGNAVFAGHVDWHTGAPALFAHLDALGPGDEIDVSRADGILVRYHVDSATWYPLYGTPAAPIIAPTTVPTVTLITCGGSFDQTTHEYDQRLVIRATGGTS
jgi:sortase (surface protein transpeptidase)